MSPTWRLLRDGITDARRHFAVEEALVRLLDEGASPPTLRLRQVRRAVFVGVLQDTEVEVDVDYCRANDIQIVRRANGGGAVYHDVGSFCYSAFFPRDTFPQSDRELYDLFAEPVARTCADYSLRTHAGGRNDLLVGERKIYGSAQLAWYDAFVHSGTFLVNMDFETLDRALTPPALKFSGKSARSVKERVTSLSQEVGREVPVNEVMDRFSAQFSDLLEIRLDPGGLTQAERELADELWRVKYGTDAWTFGTRSAHGATVSARTPAGVVSLAVQMEEGLIREAEIRGDLLLTDRGEALQALAHSLAGNTPAQAQDCLQKAGIDDVLKTALLALLEEATHEEPPRRWPDSVTRSAR